mmetsp:Transcript_90804/g.256450  ORF Transcript_90804/g.256450 Transcript_90804/m.256450 type:complete len:553 (+) Transcript_90804:58-1716(+)
MGSSSSTGQEEVSGTEQRHVPPKDTVVDPERVKAKKGSIAVSGRYCTSRPLSADYKVESKVVGSGMSGPVQLATGIADGRKYAVKSFKKKGLSTRKRKELKSEVEIYLQLDHPHVARLEMVFETDDEIHIVMEFMAGGELYDRLSEQKKYSEQLAASTTYQMLLAVGYLHANSCAHRDLKLENFLYESKDTDHLKLIDFGFAKFWDRSTKMEQACGSVHYVAPEVLAHAYTEKADMWSLGIIVYMLLTGSPPFHGSDDEVLRKIRSGKPQYSSRFQRLSENAKGFVKSLLVLDPDERLSAVQALDHPFVKEREVGESVIDMDIVKSLQSYAHASHFKRACYSMMAWSLTQEHRCELRQQFLALDRERKGTITHSELMHILSDNFHIDSDEAERLFRSLDTDNDGEIAYSDFLAGVMQDRICLHEDVLRKTFSRFDEDQNGCITVEDLRKVLGDSFEGEDLEDLIKDADANKDGSVSYDEFLMYFKGPDAAETPAQRDRKRKNTEKMAGVLDSLMPDHADDVSPLCTGTKTPMMRPKPGTPFSGMTPQHAGSS